MHATGLVTLFLAFTSAVCAAPISKTDTHTGDVTFFNPGLGACGKTNSGNDLIVAVPSNIFSQFGPQVSNGNPVCGKSLKVTVGKKSVTVKVVDKCPGCGPNDIDLSPAAFENLASLGVGRIHKAKWRIL